MSGKVELLKYLTILRKVECRILRLSSHVDRTFRFLRVWLVVAVNIDKEKEREFAIWQALLHCFDLVYPSCTFPFFTWASGTLAPWAARSPQAHLSCVVSGKLNYDKTKLEAFVLFSNKKSCVLWCWWTVTTLLLWVCREVSLLYT